MMEYRSITSSLLLLLINLHLSRCLQCYFCSYEGGVAGSIPECQNPTKDTVPIQRQAQDTTAIDKAIEMSPKQGAGRQGNQEVCVALFGSFNGNKGILRGKSDKGDGFSGCLTKVNQDLGGTRFIGSICLCNTQDLCNGENDPKAYGESIEAPKPSPGQQPGQQPGQEPYPNSSGSLLTVGLLTTLLTAAKIIVVFA